MYICPFSFYCTHKVLYLYQYFMTTISECFSTVSNGCMLSHWKWLTFYILKCLLYTDDYLLFVHVLYMLLCDDRASCKTACGWWVILYKYVLIKKNKKKKNHQPHNGLLNCLFRHIWKKTWFTELFIQAQMKENIKAPRHWPLWGEFTGDRWIPLTKDQ